MSDLIFVIIVYAALGWSTFTVMKFIAPCSLVESLIFIIFWPVALLIVAMAISVNPNVRSDK